MSLSGPYISSTLEKHPVSILRLLTPANQDIPVVTEYFERLGVPLFTSTAASAAGGAGSAPTINADFSLGLAAPTANVSTEALTAAFQRYAQYLAVNFSTVYPGYYLPDPVPEDLLLPYGEFMTKYGLEPIVNLINTFIQPAEATKEIALYPLKLLALDPLLSIQSGFKVTPDLQVLYRAAQAILGDNVFYNSTVTSLSRSDSGVEAVINTPEGPQRIKAKKLLMSAPPVASNLAGWDVSATESDLFGKFKGQQYYASIIRHTGLPNATLQNVGFTTAFNLPSLPALFNVVPTGLEDRTSIAYYAARERVEPEAMKADTIATLNRLSANGVIGPGECEFVEVYDHANVRMYVEPEEIRDGFYTKLYALQGVNSTYWTGAAWVTQASSPIWDYTKALVSTMVATA